MIIGNSTFSWWQAYIGQKRGYVQSVIHSGEVFNPYGPLGHLNTSLYYPRAWTKEEE